MKKLKIAWADLESAFENNAPDVHSYLNLQTGDVVTVAETTQGTPDFQDRLDMNAPLAPVRPFSSREQYRWLQGFITSVEEPALRAKLGGAIDGPGAFRRFKSMLLEFPNERSRWFDFRNQCAHDRIEEWLKSLGVEPVDVAPWRLPAGEKPAEAVVESVGANGEASKESTSPAPRSPISSSVAATEATANARPVELAQFISNWLDRWAPAGIAATNVAVVEDFARAITDFLAGKPESLGTYGYTESRAAKPLL
ncbi:MAG: hypothetical protein HYY84_03090 [Deltaproteobacteria bacterium]|nr:hypothetical protein [Deltaproteobacteria bacterium]